MPLTIVKDRLEKSGDERIKEIYKYLEEKGAKLTWKDAIRND
jgi:disulfide oxidoreductase YuzD